jgi:hypothetical protein
MSKNSTFLFTINNLASKTREEITETDSIFDFKKEFGDVYTVLNELEYDVRDEVVNSILDFANCKH